MIRVVPPILNDHARLRQGLKRFGIQTFPPNGALEACVASILPEVAQGNTTRCEALCLEELQ